MKKDKKDRKFPNNIIPKCEICGKIPALFSKKVGFTGKETRVCLKCYTLPLV